MFVNANAYYFNPTGIQLELSIDIAFWRYSESPKNRTRQTLHLFTSIWRENSVSFKSLYPPLLSLAMKSSEPSITRKFLKARLLRDYHTFRGFTSERTHVKDLLLRTVETGESNSALIVGPRGSGKTTVGGQEEGLMQSVQLIVTLVACS